MPGGLVAVVLQFVHAVLPTAPDRSLAGPLLQPPGTVESCVFQRGDEWYEGVHCYRIPSIIPRRNDSGMHLLALAEARTSDTCEDGTAIAVAARDSNDGGATWQPIRFIGGSFAVPVGNPTAMLTLGGRIIVLLAVHKDDCDAECVSSNAEIHSDDHGATWSRLRNLTWTGDEPAAGRPGPGIGLTLKHGAHRGRMVFTMALGKGSDCNATVVLSDDDGQTWRPTFVFDQNWTNASGWSFKAWGYPGLDESQLVEQTNGTIAIELRNTQEGVRGRAWATSYDGGETFGPLTFQKEILSPSLLAVPPLAHVGHVDDVLETLPKSCQASTIQMNGTLLLTTSFAYWDEFTLEDNVKQSMLPEGEDQPMDSDGWPLAWPAEWQPRFAETRRQNLTLFRSDDGGASWNSTLIEDGLSAYSCMVNHPVPCDGADPDAQPGCVGVLYEAYGPTSFPTHSKYWAPCITFRRFSLT